MKSLLLGLVLLVTSATSIAQTATGCSLDISKGEFVDNFKFGTLYVNARGHVPTKLEVALKNGTTLSYNNVSAIPGKENYKWSDDKSHSLYPLTILKVYPFPGGNVYDFTIKIFDAADTKAKEPVLVLDCRYAFYRM